MSGQHAMSEFNVIIIYEEHQISNVSFQVILNAVVFKSLNIG